MKHIIATTLLAVASLMAHRDASAQDKLQVTVPFEFTVGQNLLPAGTYEINFVQPQAVELSNQAKHINVFAVLTSKDDVRESPDKMIFNRYGNQYFLNEIHGGYGQSARKVSVSKREQRLRLEEASLVTQQKTLVAMK
jgi:hypothetical protein